MDEKNTLLLPAGSGEKELVKLSFKRGEEKMYQLYLLQAGTSIMIARVGPLGFPWGTLFSLLEKLWMCFPYPCATSLGLSQLIFNSV